MVTETLAAIDRIRTMARGPAPPPELDSVRFNIHDRYGAHPGQNLTPRRVVAIEREAELGRPQQLCALIGDVLRRDSHLRSQVEMRLAAVAGKSWIIQAGGETDADLEAAALLEPRMRRVPNMRHWVRHMLRAPLYGWSLSEPLWLADDDGIVAPVWLENVQHRRVIFDGYGRPRLPVATEAHEESGFTPPNVSRAPDEESLEIGPGWIFASQEEHEIATSGLLLPAIWMSLFKGLDIRDMVIFNERFGLPFVIGKYGDATPKEEKENLVRIVASIGRDGYGVAHNSCEVETVKVETSGTPSTVHIPAIAFFNAEISKLMTWSTLTSGEGTSTGSYALGTVHQDSFFICTEDNADQVGDHFQQQIGARFVEYNHLDGAPPRMKIHVVKDTDPVNRLNIMMGAAGPPLNIPIDADQARTELQLKKPRGESFGAAAMAGAGRGAPAAGGKPSAADIVRKVIGHANQ